MNEAEQRLTQVRAYATQCIKEEAEATLNLINQLDENFDKAVSLMFHCTGKVIVTGVGKSGNIGAKIAATLLLQVHLHSLLTLWTFIMAIWV